MLYTSKQQQEVVSIFFAFLGENIAKNHLAYDSSGNIRYEIPRHQRDIQDILQTMIKNPNKKKVMLGSTYGNRYYYLEAGTEYKNFYSSYYDDLCNKYGKATIMEANKEFILSCDELGNEFYFSHDPHSLLKGSAYEMEITLLNDLGYTFEQIDEYLWHAVK